MLIFLVQVSFPVTVKYCVQNIVVVSAFKCSIALRTGNVNCNNYIKLTGCTM